MRLGFYLNPIIRVRDGQYRNEPDPALIAGLAEGAGMGIVLMGWAPGQEGGLTERDARLIREMIHGDLLAVTTPESRNVDSIVKLRPEGVVLVGSGWDGRTEARPLTPENEEEFSDIVTSYHSAGIQISALVEPDINRLKNLSKYKLDGVTLDASKYTHAQTDSEAEAALDRLSDAAMAAYKLGLLPSAAHGLNYRNIGPVSRINYLEEIYIGHAIVARSLVVGLDRAIGDILTQVFRNSLMNR
ncbi:MAG: pyridoxine 5'-phosphate synthase [Calditrichota bacterium]